MKLLFIVFSTLEKANGISKKIQAQVNALRENGIEVSLCHYKMIDNIKYWALNDIPFARIGSGLKASLRHYYYYKPIEKLIKTENYNNIYLRYIHNATPWMLNFFSSIKKNGIKIFMEIPTFPYDGEYIHISVKDKLRISVEKICRKSFHKYLSKIITFSEDTKIFNVPTLRISNAVELSKIPVVSSIKKQEDIHLFAVANLSFWHGYDRLIKGMADYYKLQNNPEVHFDFVGGGELLNYYKKLTEELHLESYVHFHGLKSGKELDRFYDNADLCIGCLGCHRKNIFEVKSLKNIEYAAHGLPMAYSENNSDFDNAEYVIKLPADESNVDVSFLIDSLKKIKMTHIQIRNSVSHLDWKVQMGKVVNELK